MSAHAPTPEQTQPAQPLTPSTAPLLGRGWSAGLAGLAVAWLGVMGAVGGLAAPVLFAVLERQQAGQVAGRLFALEAQGFCLVAVAMILMVAAKARRASEGQGQAAQRMPDSLLWLLGALMCTVLGHFALQPLMAQAKAGQDVGLSFGQLHGLSSVLFLVKALALAGFAWAQARVLWRTQASGQA